MTGHATVALFDHKVPSEDFGAVKVAGGVARVIAAVYGRNPLRYARVPSHNRAFQQ